jgi:hypothetical protein
MCSASANRIPVTAAITRKTAKAGVPNTVWQEAEYPKFGVTLEPTDAVPHAGKRRHESRI